MAWCGYRRTIQQAKRRPNGERLPGARDREQTAEVRGKSSVTPKQVAVRMEQPWYCTFCGVEAHLECWSNEDSLAVKTQVLAQHAILSPQCENDWLRFRELRTKGPHGYHSSEQ